MANENEFMKFTLKNNKAPILLNAANIVCFMRLDGKRPEEGTMILTVGGVIYEVAQPLDMIEQQMKRIVAAKAADSSFPRYPFPRD